MLIVISVVKLKSSFDRIIREFRAWVRSHQQVKMRPDKAKAEHFSKIDRTQAPDERRQDKALFACPLLLLMIL
jgi:hypothetical protein